MAFWSPSSITDIYEGSTANDGTGDSLRDAFFKVDDNFTSISNQLGSEHQDFLNANISNALRVGVTITTANLAVGNVTTSPVFYGNLNLSAHIIPVTNGMYDLGSPTNRIRTVYTLATDAASQIQSSSDSGLLIVHANAYVGDTQDTGIFGNITSDYASHANTYCFFGHQFTTNDFVYKITNTNATKGNSVVYDGIYGAGHFGSMFLSNSTAATSNVTGALVVTGGISTSGNIHAAGNIFSRGYRVLNTADVNNLGYPTYNGSGSLFVGNTVFATTTPSTTTTTGAVVLLGGLGVGGNVVASGFVGDFFGNVVKPAQPFITSLGTLTGLTVNGTTNTTSLQATSVGASGILSTSITTSTLSSTSANFVNLTVTNKATIGNIDVTTGTVTISPDNTATGFVTTGALTNPLLTLNRSVNSFIQSAMHNSSSGTSASSDFIAYADNGNNSKGFVDLGIASTGFTDPAYAVTKAGDSYLFASAPTGKNGNLVIATDGSGAGAGSIIFSAGGFTSGGQTQGQFINGDGLIVTGNLVSSTGSVYQGPNARRLINDNYLYTGSTGYTNSTAVFSGDANNFIQLAVHNNNYGVNSSTDVIAYASNGDNLSGFMDMGITSNTFSQIAYSVTGKNDGYIFMSAPSGTTGNGSMFLSTASTGQQNDIVFTTNGFTSGTERMRIIGQSRTGKPAGVEIYISTSSTSTSTGALRVQGGIGLLGNLYAGGNVVVSNNLSVGGAVAITGAISGVAGITSSGAIIPSANVTYDLGSNSAWWRTLYGVSTQAKYADLAENYQADVDYAPGTVVVFGGTEEITTTTEFADARVAGAISTNPAHLMNGGLAGTNVVPLALRGRVPCNVVGPVQKGDLLVTSKTPGFAQSVGTDRLYSLSVFAKALETDLSNGEKVIEVVIL